VTPAPASTAPRPGLLIRPAKQPGDDPALWAVLEPILREGETYAMPRDMPRDAALEWWTGPDRACFVAQSPGGEVLGTSYLKPNQAGGGAHVANAGYCTAPAAHGRGVARALLAHSLAEARARGFVAMQFNFVVATNTRAVRTWSLAGFREVGRLPGAFRHPRFGAVDALVMWKDLVETDDAQ
jgi:ribosomal protein S18 acetylase RimI-like enzyme